MSIIKLDHVNRKFKIAVNDKNFVRYVLNRKYQTKEAVKDVSFSIDEGELVGFIGPNGAGKSTTIKMMCGILVPSSGDITVLGRTPYKNRKKNSKEIGVVFGQKSQLWWDLPPIDTFSLFKKIYKIDDAVYERNLNYYGELLEINEFMNQPVRQLSLGQRMRADLCAALLHDPKILFLDEPTIGLDVLVKKQIRDMIKEINCKRKITVVLTTHDMKDIEEICSRIIMINNGQVMLDKPLEEVKSSFSGDSEIRLITQQKIDSLKIDRVKDIQINNCEIKILFVAKDISAAEIITSVVQKAEIINIEIKEPEIDDIIRNLYSIKGN
jgi:ABC-type uncharacterized transport system, ATPase component